MDLRLLIRSDGRESGQGFMSKTKSYQLEILGVHKLDVTPFQTKYVSL
jgi:hypothetical protein